MRARFISLLALAVATGCSSTPAAAPDDEPVGSASVALTEIPPDVACVRITVTGSTRKDARAFDVGAGRSSTLSMANLPLGNVTFLGEAFPSACNAVATESPPSWVSDPTPARLVPGALVNVAISMHRSGRAGVSVGFDDDGGVTRRVTTLAGAAGKSASLDGVGALARFVQPVGITADNQGNLYVVDGGTTIRKVVIASGQVTTIAGVAGVEGDVDGVGAAARLAGATGITFAQDCAYFVEPAVVRRLCPSSRAVTTIAGNAAAPGNADGPAELARFSWLSGIAADERGVLFAIDSATSTVRRIDSGVVSTVAGVAGVHQTFDGVGTGATFTHPTSIAADGIGHLFVIDGDNAGSLRRIDVASGAVTTVASVGTRASSIAAGFLLYLTNDAANTVSEIDPLESRVSVVAGVGGQAGGTDGSGAQARFFAPRGVAVDRAGTVYVSDTANSTIRKLQ